MVLFNYSTKELTAKVVYYGPGLCGKTTNLQYIHGNLPGNVKGKMLSLATKTDRTLFFDFLPIDLGNIRGMKTRVQLYTVPGQVFYNETRKLVLKGADGIVFVADSQKQMVGANAESFKNLEENLRAHGLKLAEMPHVIQFNKRDLPKLATIEELNAAINKYNAPFYESVATTGIGVQDTLKAITKLVLLHLTRKYDPKAAPAETAAAVPAAPPAPDPSMTQQIPVAAMSPAETQAIPLAVDRPTPVSHVGGGPAPSPPSAPPRASEPSGGLPRFADNEIDELVDEVEENVAATPAATPVEPPAPTPASPFEIDDSAIELEEPPVAAAPTPAPSEPAPPLQPVPAPADDEAFEFDHQMDPDWQPPAPEPAQVDSPPRVEAATPVPADTVAFDAAAAGIQPPAEEPFEIEPPVLEEPAAGIQPTPFEDDGTDVVLDPAIDPETPSVAEQFERLELDDPMAGAEPEPSVLSPGGGQEEPFAASAGVEPETPDELLSPADPAATGDTVMLREVATDHDLFDDPNLEIAQVATGEDREIVIPVELGDTSGEARRFKLTLRLRLDPVE